MAGSPEAPHPGTPTFHSYSTVVPGSPMPMLWDVQCIDLGATGSNRFAC